MHWREFDQEEQLRVPHFPWTRLFPPWCSRYMARASLTFLSRIHRSSAVRGSLIRLLHPCLFLRAEIKYRGVRSFR